jgi:hypothetical protein
VCAGFHGAQAHWLLGYPEKGLAISTEALALAERIGHPFSLAAALLWNAMLHLDRGEPELALQRLEAGEALVAEQRLSFVWEPRFVRGAALSMLEAFEGAVASLREGLAGRPAVPRRPYGLARLAEALARQDKHGAALAAAREGLETQEQTGERLWAPELHRLEGIALCGLNQLDEGKTPSKRHCASRERNRQRPMNCAPRRASRASGASRAGGPKGAICSRPFTAGSPRALST